MSNYKQAILNPEMDQLNQRKQRLMIDKITLENFKSYYGKLEIGPLHKCFTAVVGPNGSGKSNLIESLLFVFGKKAKQMRLERLQQLIHNSGKHQNLASASVKIRFHDIQDDFTQKNSYKVVPGSNFEVSRTVYKNGSSKYFINGNDCGYEQMTELLKSKGIDLNHNRFLILQGEVEQISLMPPKAQKQDEVGLLEYLEDIIGTIKYNQDITDLEKLQEDGQERKQSKMLDLYSTNDALGKLEKEKDAAINLLNKERVLYLLKNINIQLQIRETSKEMQKSGDQIEKLKIKDQQLTEYDERIRFEMRQIAQKMKRQKLQFQNKSQKEKVQQQQEKQWKLKLISLRYNQMNKPQDLGGKKKIYFKLQGLYKNRDKRSKLSSEINRLIYKLFRIVIKISNLNIKEHQLKLPQFDFNNLERQLKQKQEELDMIRQRINNLKTKNKVLFELFEAQNRGQLRGILGRLGDLGSIDQIKAFYLALGNCLVAQNLEDAIEVGYYQKERHQVVTLKGALIQTSGTMSGGGKPKQGGMSSDGSQRCQYTEENSIQLQNEIEQLVSQIREAKELKPQLQRQFSSIQREKQQSELQIQSNRINLEQLNQHLYDQERRLQQITSQSEAVLEDFLKIQEIQNQIQNINDELDQREPQIEQFQTKINLIDEKIHDLMSPQHNKSNKNKIESQDQILNKIDKSKSDEVTVLKDLEQKMQEIRGQ
ncbi:structural maintenance of chromosomes protein 4-like [Stylonychia lemnae]|uniref:Structural maintenance of chromosomes protein 4-like n=1 Tax=Stylonychia lemnae TaxID=5949 RepID=A0A078ATA3_STYLE|nr:structural maintenance of chromosomes protein 4-like [Stylonychia lemnae]|eukprot:CDW85429.1 structural maintenance of chromosomes protein 4-like [Stylonychia lemnae]